MYCKWVVYFDSYYYFTDCGHQIGRDAVINSDTCICGRKIKKYIRNKNGSTTEIKSRQIQIQPRHVLV
jgi:hypothetical protein